MRGRRRDDGHVLGPAHRDAADQDRVFVCESGPFRLRHGGLRDVAPHHRAWRAAELLLTGRTMGADEGERWGFFNRLVPAGQAADEALAQAQAICMQTGDFKRAYRAFVKKEKPVFEGN